jgi:acyl-CoA thioesterase
MEGVKRYFKNDQLARTLGIELTEVAPGRAVAVMTVDEPHYNSLRIAHGGAIFALADLAFAAACNTHGTVAVAINAHISFVKAVPQGLLTAEAEEVSLTPKLATCIVTVKDKDDETVAVFQGTAYRKRDPLPIPDENE